MVTNCYEREMLPDTIIDVISRSSTAQREETRIFLEKYLHIVQESIDEMAKSRNGLYLPRR